MMFILAVAGLNRRHSENWLVDFFYKGGPIMWPILIVSIIAIAVLMERIIWWARQKTLRETSKLEQVFTKIEQGDLKAASGLARNSQDPRLRVIYSGINHPHTTMQSALQVQTGIELQRAARFSGVLDTIVTLAPLLGLLGTVTGIMGAFNAVGESGLDPSAVSGGIGEALIATACGLGVAMICLIPYNYFTAKVERLKFELDTASTNLEVMTRTLKHNETSDPNALELTHAA